jgi:hypothetical protein
VAPMEVLNMSEFPNHDHPIWRRLRLMQLCLLLALLGGLCMLLMDIRYEHRAVLAEKWQARIPIFYLSASLLLVPVGILSLRRIGRHLLGVLFAGLIVVGCLGFWFHAQGKPVARITSFIQTIMRAPGHLEADDESVPPILAPLALVGLGAIGILAAWVHPTTKSKT